MFSIPMNVVRTVTIAKPARAVYDAIANFKTWEKWSPWLRMEPKCKTTITGTAGAIGHSQTWDGETIGSGQNTIKTLQESERIELDLQFFKPWKSQSVVIFSLKEEAGQTTVTWDMRGSLPFFMFFMKNMMLSMIGGDFERGLTMLKHLLEKGNVPTRLEIKGESERKGFNLLYKKNSCAIKDVGPVMHKDFMEIFEKQQKGFVPAPDMTICFYDKYDIANGVCEYTAGVGYFNDVQAKESGLTPMKIENHRAFQVDHFGPYLFLGNAWMAAINYQRCKKMKMSKSIPMYEIYKTMPGMVPDDKIHTEIFIPLK